MTLNKTYVWAVERPRDKFVFLAHVLDVCYPLTAQCARFLIQVLPGLSTISRQVPAPDQPRRKLPATLCVLAATRTHCHFLLTRSFLIDLANPIALPSTPNAPSLAAAPISPTTPASRSLTSSPPPSSASSNFQQPEADPRLYTTPPPSMSPERNITTPLSPPQTTLPVASRTAPSPTIPPAARVPQRPVEISPTIEDQPGTSQKPSPRATYLYKSFFCRRTATSIPTIHGSQGSGTHGAS